MPMMRLSQPGSLCSIRNSVWRRMGMPAQAA